MTGLLVSACVLAGHPNSSEVVHGGEANDEPGSAPAHFGNGTTPMSPKSGCLCDIETIGPQASRPSQDRVPLRVQDCTLPARKGAWGRLCLAGATPYVAPSWTDDGEDSPRKALKHRAKNESRDVPACPQLVAHHRAHIDEFGTAKDGRLFIRADGGPVRYATFASVWCRTREAVLSPAQFASPLAKRPYDLRHACVSTWLNAGVAAPQVAEWAGHSVEMLLSTYAKCIDGQEELARRRIQEALEWAEPEADPDA